MKERKCFSVVNINKICFFVNIALKEYLLHIENDKTLSFTDFSKFWLSPNHLQTNNNQAVAYLLADPEEIHGLIILAVLQEEVGAPFEQLRVSSLIQVSRNHLQGTKLLRAERQVQRSREITSLQSDIHNVNHVKK